MTFVNSFNLRIKWEIIYKFRHMSDVDCCVDKESHTYVLKKWKYMVRSSTNTYLREYN